jgi:NhaP-type Na+/H+ or K+/H+ antiporter
LVLFLNLSSMTTKLAASEGFSFADPITLAIVFVGLALLVAITLLSKQPDWGVPIAAIYLLLGAVASLALWLLGIPGVDPIGDAYLIEHLTEFAVIVALFSAALKIKRDLSIKKWSSPLLLVLIAMPLTILGVTLFANLVVGLSIGAAILLGAILAPTDPVLAGEIGVEEVGDGEDEEHRFALSGESGLNDGFAFPFIFLGVFVASGASGWFGEWVAADLLYAVIIGLALGALAGFLLGRLIDFLDRLGFISEEYEGWVAFACLLMVYGFVEFDGAYGFLAVFAAGLAYRRRKTRTVRHYKRVNEGLKSVEHIMELALMVLIGSMLTFVGLSIPGIAGWGLVFLLLFFIRPVSVFIAFLGSRLNLKERFFVAWFGIRGLGSLYYAAVVFQSDVLSRGEIEMVFWITMAAIVASVIIHGLTAEPLTKKLHLHSDHIKEAKTESK